MPIYEYECPQCGHVFEEWVKLTQAHSEEPCPQCGTLSSRRISHTSFVLKGGGWYVTDYGYRKDIHEDAQAKPKETNASATTPEAKAPVAPTPPPKAAPSAHP